MSKQVDVKALISHVIRGDGVNKCRICMGDTSEGQVHLNDIVLMEGDKPVPLSEVLEIVTGIPVLLETELPRGLCNECTNSALCAWNFKSLCSNSELEWKEAATVLAESTEGLNSDTEGTIFYICLNKEGTIFKDHVSKILTLSEAADRFNNILKGDIRRVRKKPKDPDPMRLRRRTKCNLCGKVFNVPQYLNQHLISSNKRACTVCFKILPKEKLPVHLKKAHGKIVNHCGTCYQIFDDYLNLIRHEELHGLNLPQCKICKHGFKNDRSLRAHMYSHTLFNCSKCNKSFENRKCYVYHREHCSVSKKYAENKGVLECDMCGKKYTKKPSLRIHIIQKHMDVLPFVCQICGKRMSTESHLKSHELVHTTERKLYQCHCGATMKTVIGYHMHQRIHSGEKPYKCGECGDRFLSASRRLDHMKRRHRHGATAHNCEKCGAGFIRPFELKKHLAIHGDVKEVVQ